MNDDTIVMKTPDQIAFAQLAARKAAVGLELKGLRRRGQSATSICKQVYGLKGSRQKIFDQLQKMVDTQLGVV